ncbi:MAG: MinD/ParA family protein [Geminicoccaceae bacterium]|nr:MinD/ParA family protein [Geminicoccaceae bacterium]
MGELIGVASGKGGVGKTWLSITLGHALTRLGRRVLLFDGDLGLANLDIQLGVAPVTDLGAVLTGRAALKDAILSHPPTGLDLICGRSGSGRLAELSKPRIQGLLEGLGQLARQYDYVLLDLAAGLDIVVRQAMLKADRRLVVTTDEPTALTDAYALIKVGEADGARGRLMVAINLADDGFSGASTFDGLARVCERFLDRRPESLGVVRRDARVRDAIRNQSPLLERHPGTTASKDVEAMARRLTTDR